LLRGLFSIFPAQQTNERQISQLKLNFGANLKQLFRYFLEEGNESFESSDHGAVRQSGLCVSYRFLGEHAGAIRGRRRHDHGGSDEPDLFQRGERRRGESDYPRDVDWLRHRVGKHRQFGILAHGESQRPAEPGGGIGDAAGGYGKRE
jgi:hypothetical protein